MYIYIKLDWSHFIKIKKKIILNLIEISRFQKFMW